MIQLVFYRVNIIIEENFVALKFIVYGFSNVSS
jgi:hypothetical protein